MRKALRVLFATPEIAPWQKTGGLGEVAAALPRALHGLGLDVRLLVPAYPALRAAFRDARPVATLAAPGGLLPASRLLETITPDGLLPLWLLDCPSLFDRPGGPYRDPERHDWPDNHLRFGLLSRVAALLAADGTPLRWRPDVLQCNDWQAGLAPAYLHYRHGGRGAATVMAIHNLAFQGQFDAATVADLDLPPEAYAIDGVECYGHLSFLKAGLQFADFITTVSPTYAGEIQGSDLGFGLDGLLRHRSGTLRGILNGIDERWNPARDAFLVQRYDSHRLAGKDFNRRALQAELGFAESDAVPLFGIVSRLTHQKGIDLVLAIADDLLAAPARLVILGEGEAEFEAGCRALAQRHAGRVAAVIGFDEGLAHRIEAGADIFLMPSRFEPCGLNQMYSLRYGTPPVVHSTGGLADTVVDCSPESLATGTASGFAFADATAAALLGAARRALACWQDRSLWRRLQHNGMAVDYSWRTAAGEYLRVYQTALEGRHP